MSVSSNVLPKSKKQYHETSESSLYRASEEDESDLGSFFDDEQQVDDNESFRSPQKVEASKFKLPDTLLREPLDQKKVLKLSKKEKRIYNIQKQKYETVIKTNAKKKEHPRDTPFSLDDARKLFAGKFHTEEDEDGEVPVVVEQKAGDVGEEGKVFLNRAMLVGKNEPKHELNLDEFDQALQNAIWDRQGKSSFNLSAHLMKGDHVPQELKTFYNLPKDMSEYEINYQGVREDDA